MRRIAAILLGLGLALATAGCEKKKPVASQPKATPTGTATVRWKGILMTGDDSIDAFDNARKRLKDIWLARGIKKTDVRELSMKGGTSSERKLAAALKSLKLGPKDGCILHLTSHGSPWGLYMRDQAALTPYALDKLLTEHCGSRPTVLMVSACYSGVFTQKVLRKKNRILFSAARDDRNSFGCGVENEFTFWDGCVVEHLPSSTTWTGLHQKVVECIRVKERDEGVRFSYPQVHVGDGMKNAVVFGEARE